MFVVYDCNATNVLLQFRPNGGTTVSTLNDAFTVFGVEPAPLDPSKLTPNAYPDGPCCRFQPERCPTLPLSEIASPGF